MLGKRLAFNFAIISKNCELLSFDDKIDALRFQIIMIFNTANKERSPFYESYNNRNDDKFNKKSLTESHRAVLVLSNYFVLFAI